ncbi:hypothetical protein [Celeribacter arenosi]|uniref:Polyketide cyclase / dehydrase and lipid transport n=1 Tax=Celeribacter arenosi TaxID=792649 RepID=A0ABP7KDM6_9RHOB
MSVILFRLYLYRRLTLFCAALPTVPALFTGQPIITVLVIFGLGCVFYGALLVALPDSWIEAAATAISNAIVVLVLAMSTDNIAQTVLLHDGVWSLALGFVIWAAIALVMVKVLIFFDHFHFARRRVFSKFKVPLTLEQAAEAFCHWPDKETRSHRCGPLREDGLFPVWFNILGHNLETFEPEESEHAFLVRPMSEIRYDDRIEIIIQAICEVPGGTSTQTVARTQITREGDRTVVEIEEISDAFTVFSWAFYWLRDYGRDHARGMLDSYLARPSPSTMHGKGRSLLALIAKQFVHEGADKNGASF